MVANVKAQQCIQSILCVWIGACMCRFTNCALHALYHRPLPLLLARTLFLFPCLSSILISLHHCHHSLISVRLDCVSNLCLSISLLSLFLFSRSHHFPSFIRSIQIHEVRGDVSMDWNDGNVPHHLHLLLARTMILLHWLQCIGFIDVLGKCCCCNFLQCVHSSFTY